MPGLTVVPPAHVEQARDASGKFTHMGNGDSGQIDLWEEPQDGTFEFPPSFTQAKQVVDFWVNVKIPDGACRSVVNASQALGARDAAAAEAAWDAANPKPVQQTGMFKAKPTETYEQWMTRRNAALKSAFAPLTRALIQPDAVRPIIRAACMYRDSNRLTPRDQAAVRSMPLSMPRSGGQMTTPAEVWQRYRFDEIKDAIRDPGTGDTSGQSAAALARVEARIARLTEFLQDQAVTQNLIREAGWD